MPRSLALTIAFTVLALPVMAHHGPGTFELNKTVTLTGKLTRIDPINPTLLALFRCD